MASIAVVRAGCSLHLYSHHSRRAPASDALRSALPVYLLSIIECKVVEHAEWDIACFF